ncbi:trace amine-associated receptor 8-like [Patiria miniata]|uniref:G-protein coupled receptors family 1 profile domain-containing protein n=1 Tax=Patiria miniata TaxID=46514 RepID=A0A914B7F8_PATMI|nr:trace amine-associated receptor 8-like [Patiria miniata]
MASPTNSTQLEDQEPPYNPLQLAILVTLFIIIGLSMLVGYLWVIVTVARNSHLRTVSNSFLASLSVAEIFTGVLGQPSIIVFVNLQTFSQISYFFSVWVVSFCFVGYFLNAVLIAADKWFKISHPFVYVRMMTRAKCAVCLAVVWGLATVGTLLGAVGQTFLSNISLENSDAAYTSLVSGTLVYFYVFILPSIVIIMVFNCLIVRIARRQARAIAADLPVPPRQLNPGDPQNAQVEVNHRKSTKQFSIFLFTFVLAWVPLAVILYVMSFFGALSMVSLNVVFLAFSTVAVGQAAFGTFILTILQPEFRQILKLNLRYVGKKLRCFPRGSQ